jgi:hypothetical protein
MLHLVLLPSCLQLIQGFSHCITIGHYPLNLAVSYSWLLLLLTPWQWMLLTPTSHCIS